MNILVNNESDRQYIKDLKPFNGSELYAMTNHLGYYVVYSNDAPLLAAVPKVGGKPMWFANQHKYSVIASLHLSQSLPNNVDVTWLEQHHMQTLTKKGYAILTRKLLKFTADPRKDGPQYPTVKRGF